MSHRHPDTLKALKLLELLGSNMLQREFGHFVTINRHKVHYANFPDESKAIQRRLDELVSRMAIVYLFAVFDDYTTPAIEDAIPTDQLTTLSAYRHVRSSAAHGLLFERSPRIDTAHRAFDRVMQSDSPLPGIMYHSTELIFVATGIELHCRAYMEKIIGLIIGRLESS